MNHPTPTWTRARFQHARHLARLAGYIDRLQRVRDVVEYEKLMADHRATWLSDPLKDRIQYRLERFKRRKHQPAPALAYDDYDDFELPF